MIENASTRPEQNYEKNINKFVESTHFAMESILSFLSASSIFIGGHGFFKTYMAFILMGALPNILVCSLVFLISFCIYTLDKIADMEKDIASMPKRYSLLHSRRRPALFLAAASYILALLLTYLCCPRALVVILIPFIANAFYAVKIHSRIPRLKDIPLVKNLVVSVSWALVTALLPAMFLKGTSGATVIAVIYFLLAKTLVDNVLYDIRDIKGDSENGVRTMAVMLGRQKTTAVLLGANSTLLPLIAIAAIAAKPVALALVLYGFAYILYFQERCNPLALDFFVEGEWMLMAALLALFNCFFSV